MKLFELDEAALVSESLLCEVLAALVSYKALALSALLLFPVLEDLFILLLPSE